MNFKSGIHPRDSPFMSLQFVFTTEASHLRCAVHLHQTSCDGVVLLPVSVLHVYRCGASESDDVCRWRTTAFTLHVAGSRPVSSVWPGSDLGNGWMGATVLCVWAPSFD